MTDSRQSGSIALEHLKQTPPRRTSQAGCPGQVERAAIPGALDAHGPAGQLLTREEISRELWPDGTFVDYEHGVNSAVNRIREALGDSPASRDSL